MKLKLASELDNKDPRLLLGEIDASPRNLGRVHLVGSRVRDEGQAFHIKAFMIPKPLGTATPQRLEATRTGLQDLDGKIREAVVAAVPQIPNVLERHTSQS